MDKVTSCVNVTAGVLFTTVQAIGTNDDDATQEAQTTRRRQNTSHFNGRIMAAPAAVADMLTMMSTCNEVIDLDNKLYQRVSLPPGMYAQGQVYSVVLPIRQKG